MVSGQVIENSQEIGEAQKKEQRKKVLATPVARKLAKDLGIDIQKVKGTGPVGRVMKEDINHMKEELDKKDEHKELDVSKKSVNAEAGGLEERIPLSMLRKTIAKNMVLSKSVIPHAAVMEEVDVTDLVKFRKDTKETSNEQGVKLTFMPFIIKALILTLKEYPEFNSSYDEEKEEIVLKKYYNIGIATDTPGGLMVPVIKDADKKGMFEIARESVRLAEGARNKTLELNDLQNGTFSITNYGSLGAGSGIPIIKHPEVAILGVGKIVKKPVVVDEEIVIRDMIPITLCIDHRVIDGGDGARFIKKFKEYLSDPMLLVLS
jgi:pyruvate dehydrogenase E2 component (dihydrolipoamide acetyltransferase)